MEVKPDGTLIYNFKNNPPNSFQYVVERENTFSFIAKNGKKIVFDLKANDKGEDVLHGNMEEFPNVRIIMTKKKP